MSRRNRRTVSIKDLALIIPVYNEEKSIKNIILQVIKKDYPFIVVNDGSTDNSLEVIKTITNNYVSYHDNQGKGYAIKVGARHLIEQGYRWIGIIDSDGQSNIQNIEQVFNLMNVYPKAKILIGNRLHNHKSMPLSRYLVNKLMSFVVSILAKQYIPDSQCWCKIIHKDVFNNINLKCNKFDFESELLIKAGRKGYQIKSANVDCIYFKERKSKISFWKDLKRFIKLILSI